MTRRPSISVVVPNWNGRHHLSACLDSLLALDYPSDLVDVIVVDNGSTDGSVELVGAKYPQVRVLRNPGNTGFAHACNQGVDASTAEFVAFLNNDARVDPAWLRELVAVAEGDPAVAAVGSLVLDWEGTHLDFARSGLSPLARGLQLDHGRPVGDAPREPHEQLFANGAAVLVRRDAFREVGGFDRRFFAFYEDVDFGWRCWVLGWRVLVAPASRVYHRHHGTSRRLRAAQVEFLLTRNAVMAAVKNLEGDTLAALLPVLLLETASRVATDGGMRSERYRPPGFGGSAFKPPGPRLSTGRVTARDLLHAVRHGPEAGRSAIRRAVAAGIPGASVLSPRGGARVAALEDLLFGWPELMRARSEVQERRRRTDAEITALFGLDEQKRDPSDHSPRDATAAAVYRALQAAGLERLLPRA